MTLERLTQEDLAGSGAAEEHTAALKSKVNAAIDQVNTNSPVVETLDARGDQVEIDEIDLKDAGTTDYSADLGGDGTGEFVLEDVIVQCLTEDTLSGDAEITVGTTALGTELLAATALTALDAVGDTFKIAIVGLLPTVADNATLHVAVSSADSGTSGTAKVSLSGRRI